MSIPTNSINQYSLKEEIANSIIHGLGILFGIVGLTVLLVLSVLRGTPYHFACYLVYGISLILLYTSSTLYHALPYFKAKKIFKICDHISIYLLIAGTYTPFLILNLSASWGRPLLGIIWSIAFCGIIFKLFFTGRFKYLSTLIYIAMGWLIMVAAKPLSDAIPSEGLGWIIAGGCTYTFGTVFYLLKQLPFSHSIWHFFVLLGSIFHYTAIIYSANFFF